MRGSQDWMDRIALARAIKSAQAHLVESTVWLPEPGAILTAMYLNAFDQFPARRIVLTLYGSEILRFAHRPHRRALFQKMLERADRISVISRFTEGLLQKHFPTDAAKIALVPGALRSDFPTGLPARRARPADAPLILLTVGRIHPRKGQHCVLEALILLPAALRARVEYRVAGTVVDAAYQRRLEELARAGNLAVRFLGEVPDAGLPALYADADLFVMTPVPHGPSLEGFGLVYLEAGICGLPSVAHRTGGVPEAVRDGMTGLLADPSDRPSLAAALARLLEDSGLRTRLGMAARTHAREFSWSANVDTLFCRE
jgi:glycosyltransferase involved in cell wall biosynthesis